MVETNKDDLRIDLSKAKSQQVDNADDGSPLIVTKEKLTANDKFKDIPVVIEGPEF